MIGQYQILYGEDVYFVDSESVEAAFAELIDQLRAEGVDVEPEHLSCINSTKPNFNAVNELLGIRDSHRNEDHNISMILKASLFAAEKHKTQRRKGLDASPYINHPLKVAELLWRVGEVRDVDCIVAALLHDTIEDTDTLPSQLEELFGVRVRELVAEVTDDKTLDKKQRKELQIAHAASLSDGAKQIKLADKTANVFDVAFDPAPDWAQARRVEYLEWAKEVVDRMRGCNPKLEAEFDEVLEQSLEQFRTEGVSLLGPRPEL
jgi:guanosine-3',5'-bis(diphosphate) 3'-pyrophosphohydrolase